MQHTITITHSGATVDAAPIQSQMTIVAHTSGEAMHKALELFTEVHVFEVRLSPYPPN